MRLTEFIRTHSDWEEVLSVPPYCIKIKRDDGYVIFSYSQIESDFGNEIVRECRGVILEEASLKPVCVPFYKFGNYGENYVPHIDWASARVQEKIDGSLIKVWYGRGEWKVSTSGNIYADKSELFGNDLLGEDCPYKTYGDLFEAARVAAGLDFDRLDKNCTYMFELIGPYNKVVITYAALDIYHIGTRDNVTLKEFNADIGVKKPREFALGTLQDCVSAAAELGPDREGYVVVDKNYDRIKIKNPAYVALHHLKNNGDPTLLNLIALVRKNETEEFLTYFPEFKSRVEACKVKIESIISELESEVADLKGKTFETQKDFALEVKEKRFSGFYFAWWSNRDLTAQDWFWKMPDEKIKNILNNMK